MPSLKVGKVNGKNTHYSVGALIKRNGKYLLIDRNLKPFGFAGVAGHVDKGETPLKALKREVKEESGLSVVSCKLLDDELLALTNCTYGVKPHHWYMYSVSVKGRLKTNDREVKSIGWYTLAELKRIKKWDPYWRYWLKKLGAL